MATRKKKALATKSSTDIATIEQQLAAEREHQSSALGVSGGTSVTITDDLEIKLPNGSAESTMAFVIIDFAARNTWYENPPSPGNFDPPDCYALAEPASLTAGKLTKHASVHDSLIPYHTLESPVSPDCESCPFNVFGTNQLKSGKACNNRYFLILGNPDKPDDELLTINVMVSAKKAFEQYINTLEARHQKSPIQMVTHIGAIRVGGRNKAWTFENGEENANLAGHWARRAEAQKLLQQGYPPKVLSEATPAPRIAKKKAGGRRRRAT